MKKQQNNNPRVDNVNQGAEGLEDQGVAGVGGNVVELLSRDSKVTGPSIASNFFFQAGATVSEKMSVKADLLSSTRQALAEAADLSRNSEELTEEAATILAVAGRRFYQGLATGILTMDEVNGSLGDVFGFKAVGKSGIKTAVKPGDKNASKTPYGPAETLRKRVVRAVTARQFIDTDGASGGAFYEGLSPDTPCKWQGETFTLREAVKRLTDEDESRRLTVWQFYQVTADAKRDNSNRTAPPPAFNVKIIAGIVRALGENGATARIKADANLATAYGGLFKMLIELGNEMSEAA